MRNFIRIIAVLATIGIVVIASLVVFDVVSFSESKDALQKVLFTLGIVALGGIIISVISKNE